MRINRQSCILIILALIVAFPMMGFSQKKLYHIEKPSIEREYKLPKDIYFIAEKDEVIGKFTTEFANNISREFEIKGTTLHAVFKKPDITLDSLAVDSIFDNYDPNGIIILSLIGSGYMKASAFAKIRRSFIFQFQYSYRINDDEEYIQMYMTQISVDMGKIDFAEPSTSRELVSRMRKKKIF